MCSGFKINFLLSLSYTFVQVLYITDRPFFLVLCFVLQISSSLCLAISLNGESDEQKSWILMYSNIFIFSFIVTTFYLRNLCLPQGHEGILSYLEEMQLFYLYIKIYNSLDFHFFAYGGK